MKEEKGKPLPLGATIHDGKVNFSIFSRHVEQVSLILFKGKNQKRWQEIFLDPEKNRTGDIWHIELSGLPDNTCYGYRMVGPDDPNGSGLVFKKDQFVLDPYAKAIVGTEEWGVVPVREQGDIADRHFVRRGLVIQDDFAWSNDRPLNIPLKDSIIYELHVRGYTKHKSSGVKNPGTYEGLIEKIPYLQKLGVTAVELMPINEFIENEDLFLDPETGEYLKNFWGYNTISFFAPKASYGQNSQDGSQISSFKKMVKALHKAGIEVILDVVFNHTGEGDYQGELFSFRGIDNTIYYLLNEDKKYLNYSGCGNTFNCNHPLVRNFIMDCLRYWVIEMHVDGFRFDLASILGRSPTGAILSNPPMVEQIAEDPVLANTKIIAEAWDAAGVYQVGSFSTHRRWAEWNGKFRDDIRSFSCGHDGSVSALATRIGGSSDLYKWSARTPYNSINFITSHDGFSLADLVAYNGKWNHRNGEENRDGDNHNISWNSGHEGETDNKEVQKLRAIRVRSMVAILMFSQGVPMIAAGDEFGRTQQGNNNAWCQDNEISWLDWEMLKQNKGLFRFFKMAISLRKKHKIFRRCDFFPDHDAENPEVSWQGLEPGTQDWSSGCHHLAFLLHGDQVIGRKDEDCFVMLNNDHAKASFTLPEPRKDRQWCKVVDTGRATPNDILTEEKAVPVVGEKVSVLGMAVVALISRPLK